MSKTILKDEYSSEEECKNAIAEFNEGRRPEDEMRYCSYFNGITRKRMYVPCTTEYFFKWRNMLAEEHRKRDIESRCLIPSERYNYLKRCMEDCSHCPYGKEHRDGTPLSLDRFLEEDNYEIADELHTSPLDEILEEERSAALAHEISLLDEESQKILELFNEGYSEAKIALFLGLPRTTVQYRKTMLIEKLKKKLENF